MSNTTSRADESDEHHDGESDAAVGAHLQNVEDGAGCTEIWETLSERREAAAEKSDTRVAGETDAE